METEQKEENNEEADLKHEEQKEENNEEPEMKPQGQKEENPDNFSDQEIEDDFYKIQIENFKNKTTSNFHKNIRLINEKGREIRSARFVDIRHKQFNEQKEERMSKKENNSKKEVNQGPNKLLLNNSSGQVENSTTLLENNSAAIQKTVQAGTASAEEGSGSGSGGEEKAKKDEESGHESSEEENEESENEENRKINLPPPREPNEDILNYYKKLRDNYAQTKILYEDPDFPCNSNVFCDEYENPNGDYEIDFERPEMNEESIEFFATEPHTTNEYNIEHEFKLHRGLLNDKFFVGAMLMLFKKREEFFTNLVLDYEHVNENLEAGFCGFQFFMNGEWKEVTVDTKFPSHQKGEYSLTQSKNQKGPFWVSLFEKAYAKMFGSYRVLNNTLLKDFLVDFTGGWSKKIIVPKPSVIEDKTKKFFFDEITRCISQHYLIGCMKFDDSKIVEELNESLSEKDDAEEEQIITNSIYTVLDIQEYENIKLIFLCNHWDKGKFSRSYGPDDEVWESNKKLKEKFKYNVSTTDGTFWMSFDEFITTFNTIYYCRIIPETWANYTIAGKWQGEKSGGGPQKVYPWVPEQFIPKQPPQNVLSKLTMGTTTKKTNTMMKKKLSMSMVSNSTSSKQKQIAPPPEQKTIKKPPPVYQCDFKRVIVTDTEEAFFLNPQYKIELKPGNKIIISLMQTDKKMENNAYIKFNFMVVYTKGKHSRVWDLKENYIIKKAVNSEKDDGMRREIVMTLDYNEAIKRYNHINTRKFNKNERLFINLIPYMEYTAKYEVEKKGHQRIFKPYRPENPYWLRIFCNEELYITELKLPFQCYIKDSWVNENSGGPRFIINKKKYIENSHWPLNPQYLVRFEKNTKCKIILKKTTGHFVNEESKIGLLVTRPTYFDENKDKIEKQNLEKHQLVKKRDGVRLEPIQRCLQSTNKILVTKKINYQDIYPKLSINESELVFESSYNNNYCASIQTYFSRLDSPLIIIPTLNERGSNYEYELFIYSTKKLDLYPLYNENCQTLFGEWNENNAGGSHLTMGDEIIKKSDVYSKQLTYYDNPKFLIQFDSKDWIKDLQFEITIVRMASLWKRRLSQSMLNSMMSCYIFKYERDNKWKKNCLNMEMIDFMPVNVVRMTYKDPKADPKGYIIMPVTYNKNVYGPFCIMVKCKEKFTLRELQKDE